MSAKARFMKKLQEQQPCHNGFANKGEADIAEFCQRMDQLQAQMTEWLDQTNIRIESSPALLSECLIGGKTFNVPAISLFYEERKIKFTPVFLYAQGVTGGVDVTFCPEGRAIPLRRLFMRSTEDSKNWTCNPADRPAASRSPFNEDTFFETIDCLLPDE